ncbi:ABC-type transporter Mla subunit MlaD [Streptomyces calvus]
MSAVRVLRLRLYGIAFIAVLALLLSLAVAVYQQAFTPVVKVTLEAGRLGNQLDPRADVKLRGLLVGEVREVHADGTGATLDLALKPEHVGRIPSDVRARLLPKTLFGEKYVDLVAPGGSAAPADPGRRRHHPGPHDGRHGGPAADERPAAAAAHGRTR